MAKNANRLTAVASQSARLAVAEAKGDSYNAILKYGLVEQVTQPLKVATSLMDFSDVPGVQASIINAALRRQYNQKINLVWYKDMPDAEKINANAPKIEIQAWDEGVGQEDEISLETEKQSRLAAERERRTLEQVEEIICDMRSALRSLGNMHGERSTQWLNGTVKARVSVDGSGQVVREFVQDLPCAYRPMKDWLMDAMAHNQHRDSLWYTKQLYAFMSGAVAEDVVFSDKEIHDVKAAIEEHLTETVVIGDVGSEVETTRLALIMERLANRKFADWLERVRNGESGSADMSVLIAYSPDRVVFAEQFTDSLEVEEYLVKEEEAVKKMAERKQRLNRLRMAAAGVTTTGVDETTKTSVVQGVKVGFVVGQGTVARH